MVLIYRRHTSHDVAIFYLFLNQNYSFMKTALITGATSGIGRATAMAFAAIIAFVVTRPYNVNIADVLVLPTAQGSATILNKDI